MMIEQLITGGILSGSVLVGLDATRVVLGLVLHLMTLRRPNGFAQQP